MTIIIIGITIIYLLLIARFVHGFEKVDTFKLRNLIPETRFSVVIPFRNEVINLPQLLTSIQALKYPKHLFEIIFVDDDSEDNSVEIIKDAIGSSANISIIKNERKSNSPKKDAIATAIKRANFDWIITTDADCVLPKYWLDSFDEFIQQNQATCIAAPVTFDITSSLLNKFQVLDMLSLQGATIGGFGIKKPFLCNGANFGYTKQLFNNVNGFEGNTNIASGDDIFLLEKMIKKHPKEIYFLKCEDAIVTTTSQLNLNQLIAQRKRWAAKTSSYRNLFGKLTGLMVLLMNVTIIISVLLCVFGFLNGRTLFYIVFIKFNIDTLLIYKAATFYHQKEILKSVIWGFFIYPFFSVYIAFLSVFTSYKWKDRQFKK